MLRELNENEMIMVSGGNPPPRPELPPGTEAPTIHGDGVGSPDDLLSSGGVIPNNSGQGFDATFGGSVGSSDTNPSSFEEQYHDQTICSACHTADEVNPYSQYYTTAGGSNSAITAMGDMLSNLPSHVAHSTHVALGNGRRR